MATRSTGEYLPKHAYMSDVWKDGIFANKVVFCTGGAGTICSAQVRGLVALGANACIVGRNVEKTEAMAKNIEGTAREETKRENVKVLGIGAVDVRSFESLQKAVGSCVKELGGVDVVIAGAAGNFLAPIDQLSPNAFKSVIDIDVLGSFNTAKATLPHLRTSALEHNAAPHHSPTAPSSAPAFTPSLLFISATLHYTGTTPLQSHVSAAKAAIDSLSASLSIEHGPFGIRSNVIAPGAISGTEGIERLAPPEGSETRRELEKNVPLGRFGSVREISDATLWVCGPAAGWVTGAVVVVDGGAWRLGGGGGIGGIQYPDFLLAGSNVPSTYKSGREEGTKSKL